MMNDHDSMTNAPMMHDLVPSEQNARGDAIDWARDRLCFNDYVILKTATTGLGEADLVQLVILSPYELPLLDVVLKPSLPITVGAEALHGIATYQLAGALTFPDVYPLLATLFAERRVILYHAAFDLGMLATACARYQLPPLVLPQVDDAMVYYAAYIGEWNAWHGDYQWYPLPGGDQTPLGNARAVRRLLSRIAGDDLSTPDLPDFPF